MERTVMRELGNGLSLQVTRFRDPGAPPSGLTVLLVHGFMDAGGTWDLVAGPLAAAGHEVVAPDLRGFGAERLRRRRRLLPLPRLRGGPRVLVDRLAPPRLAVVGHSLGGTVSCLFAGAHPERVERLATARGPGDDRHRAGVAVDRMVAWLRTYGAPATARSGRSPPRRTRRAGWP